LQEFNVMIFVTLGGWVVVNRAGASVTSEWKRSVERRFLAAFARGKINSDKTGHQ